jgi:hypothetical protein
MNKCLFDQWYDGMGQGNFITTLFNAFIYADANNRVRIICAFPEHFKNSAFVREWITGERIAFEALKTKWQKESEELLMKNYL